MGALTAPTSTGRCEATRGSDRPWGGALPGSLTRLGCRKAGASVMFNPVSRSCRDHGARPAEQHLQPALPALPVGHQRGRGRLPPRVQK